MPSGHLATFMAAITVIAINYPEIRWIKPLGYGLMGLMAFEMMNSKVHWASDYPLALLIGYGVGTQAAKRRIQRRNLGDGEKLPIRNPASSVSVHQLEHGLLLGVSFHF